jgi:hypothetical protein
MECKLQRSQRTWTRPQRVPRVEGASEEHARASAFDTWGRSSSLQGVAFHPNRHEMAEKGCEWIRAIGASLSTGGKERLRGLVRNARSSLRRRRAPRGMRDPPRRKRRRGGYERCLRSCDTSAADDPWSRWPGRDRIPPRIRLDGHNGRIVDGASFLDTAAVDLSASHPYATGPSPCDQTTYSWRSPGCPKRRRRCRRSGNHVLSRSFVAHPTQPGR